jgi:hypothetical protein
MPRQYPGRTMAQTAEGDVKRRKCIP